MGLCNLKTFTTSIAIFSIIPSLLCCFLDSLLLIAIVHPDYILFEDQPVWNRFVGSFSNLTQSWLVIIILSIRILFRVLIILTIPCALYGNFYNCSKYLAPYKLLTLSSLIFIMITGTCCSIVFAKYIFVDDAESSILDIDQIKALSIAHLVTLLILIDGGPIMLIPQNVGFIVVHIRGQQILERQKLDCLKLHQSNRSACNIPRVKLNDPSFQPSFEMQSVPSISSNVTDNQNSNLY